MRTTKYYYFDNIALLTVYCIIYLQYTSLYDILHK